MESGDAQRCDACATDRLQVGEPNFSGDDTSMPARSFVTNRAKLFSIGRSQFVRLPDSMQFARDMVVAKRMGNGVLLLPIDNPWQLMQQALEDFEPGLVLERDQPAA